MPRPLNICILDGFSEGGGSFINELHLLGHTVTFNPSYKTDYILCFSIEKMDKAFACLQNFPSIPLYVYCWDYYKWAYEGKQTSFNWQRYTMLLRKCRKIFVPSHGQQLRLKELFDLESGVLPCSINTYEAENTDLRFVLDPVRHYPEENKGWVEQACSELNIPCVHSEHQFSQEEFRTLVSTCSFMTCAYREASTGGLSLMEGLWNGKVSLVSDSPYMGARDYVGDFGHYFKYDDYNDLKRKILALWENPVSVDRFTARKYMKENFSHEVFAQRLINFL